MAFCYGSLSRPGLASPQQPANGQGRPICTGPARQCPLVPAPQPVFSAMCEAAATLGQDSAAPRPLAPITPRLTTQAPLAYSPSVHSQGSTVRPPRAGRAGERLQGAASQTHSTRSCLSPAKSFLWIRVMLLPLSSLVEERREGDGELPTVGLRPALSSRLPLHVAQVSHLTNETACFPAKLRDPKSMLS